MAAYQPSTPGGSFPGRTPANPVADSDAQSLLAAYTELTGLLMQSPDVITFLQQVADLSAAVVSPPASVGITLRRGNEISTVASTGALAAQADELQYGHGQGPCLEAMRELTMVTVPDLSEDTRWPAYRMHAIAHGVVSSLSWPLVVDGRGVGALNLYSPTKHHFGRSEMDRTGTFAAQASALLGIVIRQAQQVELDTQLQSALVSRALIDQALGMVMAERRCGSAEAFDILRAESQSRNVKLSVVCAQLIESRTGQPVQAGRPFVPRR